MTTFETANRRLSTATRTRDERRGYKIDKKRVAIAYAAEAVIVAASMWGAWLFAKMYVARVAADPRLRMFGDRAVRAIFDPNCANLPLPQTMLGQVQTFTFRFRP